MQVKDILTKKSPTVITTTPDQSLQEAGRLLAEHNIGALVVVNKAQTPVGIISERDIVRAFAAVGSQILTQTVGDVMTTDLIVAVPEDELDRVSTIMTHKRVRHLPVINTNNELIGIISIGDVVKAQLDYFEGEALNLRHYITGSYA
jgi:CBS domain-containing protein